MLDMLPEDFREYHNIVDVISSVIYMRSYGVGINQIVATARTIRFKEIVSVIRKEFAVFLHLNRHLYNGTRRNYGVFRYFNYSSCLDVILRVDVDVGAKMKNVTEDQRSVDKIDYHFFGIDNVDI